MAILRYVLDSEQKPGLNECHRTFSMNVLISGIILGKRLLDRWEVNCLLDAHFPEFPLLFFPEKTQYRNKHLCLSDLCMSDCVNIVHLDPWIHTVIMGKEEFVILC